MKAKGAVGAVSEVSSCKAGGSPPPVFHLLIAGFTFEFIWLLCVVNPGNTVVVGVTAANVALHFFLFCGLPLERDGQKCGKVYLGPLLRYCAWIGVIAITGICMDSLLFRAGLFLPAPASGQFALVPLWLACLWVNFALALRFAFVFLQRSLIIAALFGGVGGPLSYLFGAAIGGLVTLSEPLWVTLLLLSLLWAIFLAGAMKLARHSSFRY